IKVGYIDAEQAALIANQIADLLIQDSPSNLTNEEAQRMLAIQAQIDNLESEIASQRTESIQILDQINEANLAQETDVALALNEDYNRLLTQINTSRTILAQLSDTYLQLSNRTNRLEVIERARANPNPTGIKPPIIGAAAAVVGLILAAAAVIYFEYANTSLRTTEEVETVLQVPVLGRISQATWINKSKKSYLTVDTHTQSRLAEDYRNLRVNLLASTRTASPTICIVTSPSPREGKSVTVVNLAAAMALADLDVLLIDADLRRPVLHEVLGVSNLAGLTTALFAENNRDKQSDVSVKDLVQKTRIPKLWVLPAGYTTDRSTEVFGTDRMTKLLESVSEKYAFDVILIDTPPLLAVSDASALAVSTSASVILVVNSGRTHWNLALKAKKQLEQLNVNLVGAVLNRVRDGQDTGSSYYR
ncbi:MAG: polysaccharide biosynthesis tyrosine autokinase, partial [Anaerolineae bacterium]|nr:polysaccharide biosynthesis tyrosine autokinase [Anaerolineae bacterium]